MPDTRLALDKTPNAGIPAVREGARKVKRGTTQAWIATGPIGERCLSIDVGGRNGMISTARYVTIRPGSHIVIATLYRGSGEVQVFRVLSVTSRETSAVAEVCLLFAVPVTNYTTTLDRYNPEAVRIWKQFFPKETIDVPAGYDQRFNEAIETVIRILDSPSSNATFTSVR